MLLHQRLRTTHSVRVCQQEGHIRLVSPQVEGTARVPLARKLEELAQHPVVVRELLCNEVRAVQLRRHLLLLVPLYDLGERAPRSSRDVPRVVRSICHQALHQRMRVAEKLVLACSAYLCGMWCGAVWGRWHT